jgi:enediyne biosynthesis protein E4
MTSDARQARVRHRRHTRSPRHLEWIALVAIVAVVVLASGSRVPASQAAAPQPSLSFAFTNVAPESGLTDVTVFGGTATNKYLLETTGTGVAVIDYDDDGWLDVFVVNGSVLEGFPNGNVPTSHLYRNQRDGTFRDVTAAAGLTQSGWGQAACSGDYDNDGHDDLFVTYWGQNRLYRNRGNGTFEEVTAAAGLRNAKPRWGTGCAFLDFDRDGRLDLFAGNYIDFDLASAPVPESGLCRYKGLPVACGPPGLPGGKNVLYRNAGEGRFEDVSERSGITRANGTYALGVSTLDFNNDGWVDLYVANDSNPSALYLNNKDGTFKDVGVAAGCAYSQDGKPQAGMGVAAGDYDRNGTIDLFKTNFAGDTSTLYANDGKGLCEDRTFSAGIGLNTRWLGWGVGFVDLDNDGWLDLFLVNGHVYPEVERLKTEAAYKQRKVVYRNLGNGRFEDITAKLGPPVTTPAAGRGAAFADFDNDGDIDVIVNNMNATPDLFRLDVRGGLHWSTLKLVGTRSNRNAIGARVTLSAADGTQVQEVRGGGSYFSQNDLRVHFGLGTASRIERLAVRWPDGADEQWKDVPIDRIVTLTEGTGSKDSSR